MDGKYANSKYSKKVYNYTVSFDTNWHKLFTAKRINNKITLKV